MAEKLPPMIFIDRNLLIDEQWMREQLLSAVANQMAKFEGLSAFVRATGERKGDFSVVWFEWEPDPDVVQIVAIPGRGKSPIVQTLFVRE